MIWPAFTGCPRSTNVWSTLPFASAAMSDSWLARRLPVSVRYSGIGCSDTVPFCTWRGAVAASELAVDAEAS